MQDVPTALVTARDGIRAMGGYVGASRTENVDDRPSPGSRTVSRRTAGRTRSTCCAAQWPDHEARQRADRGRRGHGPGRRPRGPDPQPPRERDRPPEDRQRRGPDLGRARGPGRSSPMCAARSSSSSAQLGDLEDRAGVRDPDRDLQRPGRRGRGRHASGWEPSRRSSTRRAPASLTSSRRSRPPGSGSPSSGCRSCSCSARIVAAGIWIGAPGRPRRPSASRGHAARRADPGVRRGTMRR